MPFPEEVELRLLFRLAIETTEGSGAWVRYTLNGVPEVVVHIQVEDRNATPDPPELERALLEELLDALRR